MKKIIAGITSLGLLLAGSGMPASIPYNIFGNSVLTAGAAEYQDYSYTVLSDGNISITRFNNAAATKAVIPAKIDGKTVTVIGKSAFSGRNKLTDITLPNSITTIGEEAFKGCYNITSIALPSSVKTIDCAAFSNCTGLTKIVIPQGVEKIDERVFWDCINLSDVTIPNSVKSIECSAFEECTGLKSIKIPDSVKSIKYNAFYKCSILREITIPSGLTDIGRYAFTGTRWLKNKQLENPLVIVNNILIDASTCKGNVNVPNGITRINPHAFEGTWDYNSQQHLSSITGITIPNSVKTIGDGAFMGCVSLKSITIPDSVTRIESYAFSNCTALENVKFSKAMTNIETGLFYKCTSLKTILIPHTITKISFSAFGTCSNLTNVNYTGSQSDWANIAIDLKNDYLTNAKINYDYCETHTYVNNVVKPTYLNKGYTIHKCSKCGYSYIDSYTNVLSVPVIGGAKASGITYNSINVSWNKTNGVNGYIVYKYDNAKKSWIRLTKITNPNTTSYAVKELKGSTTYQIAVKGYVTENNKEIGSPKLSIVNAATASDAVSNFKAASATNSSVNLTWNRLNGAEGYVVYRYNPSTKGWIRLTKTKGTSYTATGLSSATSYKFAVKPYITVNGKESGGSKLSQLFTSTNPDKVNFTVKSPSAGKAVFSWSKVRGATGYIIYYKENSKDVWHRLTVTSGTSFTKTGLKRNNTYTFTVKAYRTTGGKTYNGAFTPKNLKIK